MKNFNTIANTANADTMTANTEKTRGVIIAEYILSILASAVIIGLLLFHPDRIDALTILIMTSAGAGLHNANREDLKKAMLPAGIATALAAALIIAVKGIWILNICYMGTLPFVFITAASAVLLVKMLRK